MLKQTPLNALHRELNARLVDFGGWEMPLHYGSQIEEHHAVRRDCGVFDVSHMRVVDIRGDDVRGFLRRLLANNVDRLKSRGRALYSCMLNDAGGVLDDLIVYFMDEGWFRLVVNAATADKDIAWISQRNGMWNAGLEIAPRPDLAMVAVQGPQARARLWAALPGSQMLTETMKPFNAAQVGELFIARTGYTGEDGFEVVLPAKGVEFFWRGLLQQGAKPCGLGARDTLRLEAGMNLYGQDMNEHTTPMESGLAWTVDISGERDFVGRAALFGLVTRQLAGLVLLDKGVLRTHQKVFTSAGEGEVTSGGFSPTLNRSIALARIPVGPMPGAEVEVEIRDRRQRARIVKYPFVRNGQSLIEEQLK
jgi:aminomethyltransferase